MSFVPSNTEGSKRFLTAFYGVEKHLERIAGSKKGPGYRDTFYDLVNAASKGDAAVRRYEVDLKEYADLRNAIVHERRGDDAIAEPHPEIVTALEAILANLTKPPLVSSRFTKTVVTCSPSDPISKATRIMREGNFSQVPVYDDEFRGLLTGETVARWLASRLSLDEIIIGEPVEVVMRETEDPDNFVLLARTATIFDAKERFDDYYRRGKSLDAIVISDAGRTRDTPLGIITVFDYPNLFP